MLALTAVLPVAVAAVLALPLGGLPGLPELALPEPPGLPDRPGLLVPDLPVPDLPRADPAPARLTPGPAPPASEPPRPTPAAVTVVPREPSPRSYPPRPRVPVLEPVPTPEVQAAELCWIEDERLISLDGYSHTWAYEWVRPGTCHYTSYGLSTDPDLKLEGVATRNDLDDLLDTYNDRLWELDRS